MGSPRSLCSECLEARRRCSDAFVPSSNVVRERKEKERERRALLEFCWLASFLRNFDVQTWCACGTRVSLPSFLCNLVSCMVQKVERVDFLLSV